MVKSLCCLAAALVPCSASAQTEDPAQIFAQAMNAQQRGDYNTAVQQYRRVVKINPRALPAWINLGVALVQAGQFAEAIDSYRSALAIDPKNKQVKFYLGLAYFKKGDATAASHQFEELLMADPKDLRVAVLLSTTYLQSGDNKRALAVLEPIAASAGDNPDFLWAYGGALLANGQLRRGVTAVEAVAKQTNAPEAWLLAGQNLLTLNESVQARSDLETAARVNPALPGVETALAQAREKNADYSAAIEAFREAARQNPKDFEAWLGLGSDEYFLRDLEGARVSLKQALALNNESAPAHYALGLVEKAQTQVGEAATDLEQAVKIRPDWLEAHVQLAALYFQLHRPADGARERQIVDKLTEEQQRAGPGK